MEQALFVRGGSLYKAVGGASWEEAHETAVEQGGSLAAITSQDENDFLVSVGQRIIEPVSYLDYEDYRVAWIGLFKADTWFWSTTEEIEYTNWVSGNPSGDGIHAEISLGTWTTADGATGSRNAGDWNDAPSDGSYPYVSQGIAEIPFIRRGDSAYVIVEGPTWEEAEANANALGGHLVTINDAEENSFIAKVIQSEPDLSFFIGATDKEIEGVWTDPSGNLLTYTNWNIGPNLASEPNGGTSENYGVIYPGNFPGTEQARGTWNDASNIEEITRGVAEIHLAPNNAPTGAPTLTGDFKVGQTISIDASDIDDADNFEGWTPSYEYSWEVSGDNGTIRTVPL